MPTKYFMVLYMLKLINLKYRVLLKIFKMLDILKNNQLMIFGSIKKIIYMN